ARQSRPLTRPTCEPGRSHHPRTDPGAANRATRGVTVPGRGWVASRYHGSNACCQPQFPAKEGPPTQMTSEEVNADAVPAKFATLGLTFDDVLLQPAESDVIPSSVDTSTLFSRNV